MARGVGGGDNVNKLPVEHASAGIKPEYASFRPDQGASGVHLDKRTDEINAANRSLDGSNPYARLSADDASVALAANEAAIKSTMDRIAALGIATQRAQGRGQADDLLGHSRSATLRLQLKYKLRKTHALSERERVFLFRSF